MEILGLVAEFLFLGLGIYLYLLAIGRVKSKDPERQKKVDNFLGSNRGLIRILALAITAIMVVNIYLHITSMLAK